MKIRQGFVSNSSSSSFVLLLPRNFDVDMYVDNMEDSEISGIIKEYDMEDKNEVKEIFHKLVKDAYLYGEDNYKAFNVCSDVLKEFIVTEVEGGPGESSISLMTESERTRLKKLLDKEIRYDKLKIINKE